MRFRILQADFPGLCLQLKARQARTRKDGATKVRIEESPGPEAPNEPTQKEVEAEALEKVLDDLSLFSWKRIWRFFTFKRR